VRAWFSKFGAQWLLLVTGLVASLAAASLAAGYLLEPGPDKTATAITDPSAPSNDPDNSQRSTPSPTPKKHRPTTAKSTPTTHRPTTATPTQKPTPSVSKTCTKPVFKTSDRNGGWSTGGYYVHNNMWNSAEALGPETLYACSYHNWYVVSKQTNHAGAVKTYPNVHKDYDNVRISSFNRIRSTFAATSPHVGIYNVAYDIWANGVATSGSTEIMIWTENFKQVPAGDKVARVGLGGRTYSVWKTSDNHYIALVPTAVMKSGSIDLLAIFKWLMSKGWLPANSTLGQIDFGVEIVSTDGRNATFTFTDFSITDN
jgi:hypothetical protein